MVLMSEKITLAVVFRVVCFCMLVAHAETMQMVISPVLLLDVGEDLHMLSSNLLAIPQ